MPVRHPVFQIPQCNPTIVSDLPEGASEIAYLQELTAELAPFTARFAGHRASPNSPAGLTNPKSAPIGTEAKSNLCAAARNRPRDSLSPLLGNLRGFTRCRWYIRYRTAPPLRAVKTVPDPAAMNMMLTAVTTTTTGTTINVK